ncbi:glycosyltransferase [Roseomonas sp. USHLN139]|uniref:glycosyltransferase n=1 Tax=Roseomonas sp. USHLN139 TaxID=3081298 RepID=UPI003B02C5D8
MIRSFAALDLPEGPALQHQPILDLPLHPGPGLPDAIVAIPLRDEAAFLPACLAALAGQREAEGLAVLLLLNDCRDGSAAIARDWAPRLPFPLRLCEVSLPPAARHVGEARGQALDAAALWLEAEGPPAAAEALLLTTDADSRVAPDWLQATRQAIRAGADAVAGQVDYALDEDPTLPPALAQRLRLEARYAGLLARIDSLGDPVPQDPWPRHRMASGASLALTLAAYRRIGGLPRLAVGEDRALANAVLDAGLRLRHAPSVRAVTSCRRAGRAAGGAAATLALWTAQPGLPGDAALEMPGAALRRALLRGRARRAHAAGALAGLAAPLRLPAATLAALQPRPFSAAWRRLEALAPVLAARPLPPALLSQAILAAQALLARRGRAQASR